MKSKKTVMNLDENIRKTSYNFFDYLDKFFHQRRIIKTLKKEVSYLNNFVDVGAYKGTYTDLILNNFKPKKILMFEPQEEIFNFLKKKYSDNKDMFICLTKHYPTKISQQNLILINII